MNKFALILTSISISLLLSAGVVLADDSAIQTMARITMNLNHFPSDEDKATLQTIIDSDDSTDDEADIAMAIVNIQHKVLEKDTQRLQEIIDDDGAENGSRKLASILLRINHAPSDTDKIALAALAKE